MVEVFAHIRCADQAKGFSLLGLENDLAPHHTVQVEELVVLIVVSTAVKVFDCAHVERVASFGLVELWFSILSTDP